MISRYIAQERLPEIGKNGQEKLSVSKVFIIGCGALGANVAMYLAGAGVGFLHIADFDTIDISNLHRQVFFSEDELGTSKAQRLKQKLQELNSSIEVFATNNLITKKYLSGDYDVIVDCADNPSTTYMLDEFCHANKIPFSTAGVAGWKAQVFTSLPDSFSYADIFPQPGENTSILPCSITGIMGSTAGLAASLQTSEVLKILLGLGENVSRLITVNLLTLEFSKFS